MTFNQGIALAGLVLSIITLASGIVAVYLKTQVDIAKLQQNQDNQANSIDCHKKETKEALKDAKEDNEKAFNSIKQDIKDLGNAVFKKLDVIQDHFIECQK